jgi:hypothetical protein
VWVVPCCPLSVATGQVMTVRIEIANGRWAKKLLGGADKFHNSTGDRWGGPFVGLSDPFGECHFSRVKVSLGYDVLPALEVPVSLFISMIILPLCRARR